MTTTTQAAIVLPPLPYARDALAPHMSRETLDYHYGKHHKTYVEKTNELIAGTQYEDASLEELVAEASGTLFNNAAQVWNHTFFWSSMKPQGGGKPGGNLATAIDRDLGGFDKFKEAFTTAATGQFGSGWAWLVLEGAKLKVLKTADADTPITQGSRPLLTIDVWEHAYYLDYQNRRPDMVQAFLDNLVNWDFVGKNMAD